MIIYFSSLPVQRSFREVPWMCVHPDVFVSWSIVRIYPYMNYRAHTETAVTPSPLDVPRR